MLTVSQAAEIIETVEDSAVDSLDADEWLLTGGTGGIKTIRVGTVDRDHRFADHELPALIVAVTGVDHPFSDTAPTNACEVTVLCTILVIGAGGDPDALRGELREIAARVSAWAVDQNDADGNRLDGLLDTGDRIDYVRVSRIEVVPDTRSWRGKTCIELRIMLWAAIGSE